jgi:hypothetical protein
MLDAVAVLRLDAEVVMSDLPAALARIREEIETLRRSAVG